MYWVLSYDPPVGDDGGYFELEDGLEIPDIPSWSLGRRLGLELRQPLEVDLVPVEGFAGPPSEMYDENMCLMSDRMVRVLQEAGVDNLETYPVALRNAETGEIHGYAAVNIVGLLSAADLEKSEWNSYDDNPIADVEFDRLELKETAPSDLLMFRLAENTGTILIHDRVRDRLDAAGFATLRFVDPGDWVT